MKGCRRMSHTKNKALYNYLVNTLGVSKQMVLDYIDERLEDLISKHIVSKLDSNHIEKMILSRVTTVLTEGMPKTNYFYSYDRDKFDEYLRKVIRQILENRLNDEYEIETKLVRKDKLIVGKV
jgi:hypothetical protein